MTRRFWAFTLAETLIVMGIIGVVAALTVPNLNASTGEKEKVAKVKKIYKDLSDAYGRATAVYGPLDEWFVKDTTDAAEATRFAERMLDFIKVSKNCGYVESGTNATCMKPVKMLDSSSFTLNYGYFIITADGMSIDFLDGSAFIVDIDGPNNGTSTLGKDIFHFIANKDGVKPYAAGLSAGWSMGLDSTKWVIDNGNMDYLKTDSSGKCPNGVTVLDWTNNITCK